MNFIIDATESRSIDSHGNLFSQVTFPTLASGQRCTRIISRKIPLTTINRGFAVHRRMTDIRQVTAYTASPHTRASLTRKDKYPRLAIYLNSRCTYTSRPSLRIYADCSRLLGVSPSSLHLFFTVSAAHLLSHRTPLSLSLSLSLSFSLLLTFFLFISLLLTLFLRPVSPYCEELPSSVIVRETMRILGRSARYARRCRLDCLRRGLSKPRGVTR